MYCYCVYLFVLVRSDGNELSFFEGDVGNQTMTRADTHDVELRFVLMKRVQHDLKTQRKTSLDKTVCTIDNVPVHTSTVQWASSWN